MYQQLFVQIDPYKPKAMACFHNKTQLEEKIDSDNESITHLQLNDDFQLCVSDNLAAMQEVWQELAPKDNIFMQPDYLQALEQQPPLNMGFRYMLITKEKEAIGLVYAQTYFIRMEDSIQKEDQPKNLWQRITSSIRNWFVKKAVFNVIICGNLLLTGEHGYFFCPGKLSETEQAKLVQLAIDKLQQLEEKQSRKKYHIQMFKDYPKQEGKLILQQPLEAANYREYKIQPSMYMCIPEEWKTTDDYLNAMSSKYRVRARRAAKKGKALKQKELSLEEVEANNDRIYELYSNIAGSVGFNAYVFHKEYFLALKRALGDRIKIVALYLEDEMVAFFTAIFNGKEMEAHFLGLDYEYNRKHQVYLNILYSLVKMGIYHEMEKIDFARTALEIKSSVGAVPRDLYCYVRHRNRLSNSIMKFVFDKLTPEEKWTPRSPFKDMSIVEEGRKTGDA